jgi:cell division protein FtsQ
MDGGGRLLRSIGDLGARLAPSPLAFAGSHDPFAFPKLPQTAPRLPTSRRRRHTLVGALAHRVAHSRYLGTMLVLALMSASLGYGAMRGGQYSDFVTANGSPLDLLAKTAGFSIKAVTITGMKELTEREVLDIAGIDGRASLIFVSAADLRAHLKAAPLIKDASVTKLYPNRLVVEIEERQPQAIWQKDGVLSVVASDGTPIDEMRDTRFERLPLVVGEGANTRLDDYNEILDAAGELRDHVRAGIFVSNRRWTLKMDNDVEIALPEKAPAAAITRFAQLDHDSHILNKDAVSFDLRIPGRVVVRLTAEAAAARADALAKKTKKGAPA